MEAKGTAIKTTRDFVKTNFPDNFNKWLDSLPETTKTYYSGVVNAGGWYPMKEGYLLPIRKIAELFYAGNIKKCGEEIGRFAADLGLKGFYKVFLLVASPKYLVQKSSSIITTFYRPSAIEAFEIDSNSAGMRITQFDEIDEALEYRIAGWCQRAIELANCTGVSYEIKKSIAKGDKTTEIIYHWK